MDMSDITTALGDIGVPVYPGYPKTGARLPYIVHRPLMVDADGVALCGLAVSWNFQHAVYCCGSSVEASYNLARMVLEALHGNRVGDSILVTSMGYVGASVEGHYESQVVARVNQGGL